MINYIVVAEELDGDGTYAGGEVTNWTFESDTVLSDLQVKDRALSSFCQRHCVEGSRWMCSSYSYNRNSSVYSMLVSFIQPSMGRYHSAFYRVKTAILAQAKGEKQ